MVYATLSDDSAGGPPAPGSLALAVSDVADTLPTLRDAIVALNLESVS